MLQEAFIVYVAVVIVQILAEVDSVPSWIRENTTMRSESRCALRLRYVDLVVTIEVAVDV
jgi:hypothetical protein